MSKRPLITLATAIPALLVGMIIASHPAPVSKPAAVDFRNTDLTVDDPAPADPKTDPAPSEPTPSEPVPTDEQTPSLSDQQPAQVNTPEVDFPDLVVATDATLTGWSDPQPTDSKFSVGTTPSPTVVQYRYCVWTYSDGSTQQQTYSTRYSNASGSLSYETGPDFDCTLSTAP